MAGAHVPVHITIRTARPLPKSRPKSVESEPDTYKPDWDNLGKLVCDALNGVAWHDDAQVTELHAVKHRRRRGIARMTKVTVEWGDDHAQP
jgi:Holliday junction resolvase RusA-like endonuclease